VALRRQQGGRDFLAREERLRDLLASGVRPCGPTLTNSVGMRFRLIPPGAFLMGSPEDEVSRSPNEGPVHRVEIPGPFTGGSTWSPRPSTRP
jgi:formylglycine-generating enzyme required for sulfatase activity